MEMEYEVAQPSSGVSDWRQRMSLQDDAAAADVEADAAMEDDERMAHTTSASSSTDAAAAAPVDPNTRPALRHDWTDTSVSANSPLTASRFHSLSPSEYTQQGYNTRNAQFEHGVPIVIDNGECRKATALCNDLESC